MSTSEDIGGHCNHTGTSSCPGVRQHPRPWLLCFGHQPDLRARLGVARQIGVLTGVASGVVKHECGEFYVVTEMG